MHKTNSKIDMMCWLLLIMPIVVCAETTEPTPTFGRLFNQPSERAKLDANRHKPKLAKKTQARTQTQSVQAAPTPLPLPDAISMQGYVKRSNGASTVWINHKPVQENTTLDDVKIGRLTKKNSANSTMIKSDQKIGKVDQLIIKIPANGKYVKLKAGQQYDPETNAIKEVTTLAQENEIELLTSPQPNMPLIDY